KKMVEDVRDHRQERSKEGDVFKDFSLASQMLTIQLAIETRMREYARTLPFQALNTVFDTPSKLEALPQTDVADEKQREIDLKTQFGNARRERLSRWSEKERNATLEQEEFRLLYEKEVQAAWEYVLSQTQIHSLEDALDPRSQNSRALNDFIRGNTALDSHL